jgi:thiamine biosynthesis protein ThiS
MEDRKLKVNGKDVGLKSKISIKDYLISQNYDVTKVAVELNGEIVPKVTFESIFLNDSDKIEIVCFVGGG